MIRLALILLVSLAAPVAAGEFRLQMPADCQIGKTCFIQNYVDHDTSNGWRDFTCGPLSYDGHKGTDIALPSLSAMKRGVAVRAAAPGKVIARRDGMADKRATAQSEFGGRDCGNGVSIEHGKGWVTQYCHMKKGSIAVKVGQQVKAGAALGEIGLSGRTEFPHLHISVRHRGKVVDPFAPKGNPICGNPARKTLWRATPGYIPGGLISAGFSDTIPSFDRVKSGGATKAELPKHARALVLFGYAFGGRKGDQMTLRIDGPRGKIVNESFSLAKDQAQFFQAAGRKRSFSGWVAGRYQGHITLSRGQRVLGQHVVNLTIR